MSGTSGTGGMVDQQTTGHSEANPLPDPREAARALARFGPRLGWGLLIVGLLGGAGRALEASSEGKPTVAGWTGAVAIGASLSLGFGLAGWGMALVCQVVASLVIDHVERAGSGSRELIAELARATAALERWTEIGKPTSEPPDSGSASAVQPVEAAGRHRPRRPI